MSKYSAKQIENMGKLSHKHFEESRQLSIFVDRKTNDFMKTKAEYLSLLRSYLLHRATKYGITRIGIFGSVARDEHTEGSDVDVYIEGQLHGFFALSAIKQELEDLLECRVDLVRLREHMDAFLKERILKEGIYA